MAEELKIVYSHNDENYNFDCVDEAVNDAALEFDNNPGSVITIYAGEALPCPKASDFLPEDLMAELGRMAEDEYNDVGNWPYHTRIRSAELQAEVVAVIDAWAHRNDIKPTFCKVKRLPEKNIKVKLTNEHGDYEVVKDV